MGDNPEVKVKQGKLRGKKCKAEFSQKEYYSFLGIPYAMPPIGKLRFKPPVPIDNWEDTLYAYENENPCLQYSFYKNQIVGDEDCLYLNVYTPEAPRSITKLKAVIVNFHQGSFYCGSGSSEDLGSPEYIIHHDVVYDFAGFLNLGLKECSGNAGLKDVILALKWVKENISAFGGDPENVTLFASSAATCATHLLLLTSSLKGLIHKAILLGLHGFTDPCSYQEDATDIALEFARILGCQSKNLRNVYRFLMHQNQYMLLKAEGELRTKRVLQNPGRYCLSPFYTSIEIPSEHAVLWQHPRDIAHLMEPIPLIYGRCEHEAVLMFYKNHFNAVKNDLPAVLKKNLWQWKINDHVAVELAKKIKRYYFNDEKPLEEFTADVEKFYDDMFYCELYPKLVNVVAEKQSTPSLYVYNFMYEGGLNYQKNHFLPRLLCWTKSLKGAVHDDDAFYWMGGFSEKICDRDRETVERMGNFFTNFAKTGNPNGELIHNFQWKPYTSDDPCYMEFDESLEMKKGRIHEERLQFWDEILQFIENFKNKLTK